MRNIFFLLLILSLSATSCKNDTTTNKTHTKKDKIDLLANRYYELYRFSGSIVVIKDNSMIYNSNLGLANYENTKSFTDKTAFKIGAISELITKDIITKLIADGSIKINDSIHEHLSEIKAKFTIEDLLNHNTNFPSIEAIRKKHPELEYNTIAYVNLINDSIPVQNKSNLNYNLLGTLIEKVSNKSFQKNIEEYSNSLKLENTFYTKSNFETSVGYQYHNYRNHGLELQKTSSYDLDIAFSSSGLKATAKDLVKILNHHSNEALEINGYTTNDGFSYSLKNDTKNKTKIVVLSNFKQPITDEISNSISSILEGKSYQLPLARKPFKINKKILKDYTGNYSLNEYAKFKVLNRNDSLFTILGPNKIHLIPQSKNQFYMQDRDAAMRFLRDASGSVNRVELLDGFINGQMATKIKD